LASQAVPVVTEKVNNPTKNTSTK